MNSDKNKLKLIRWIVEEKDNSRLARVYDLINDLKFESESAKKIVGYRANGMEVSKAELLRCVRLSIEQKERGEIYTLEELEKHAETW